MTQKTWKLGEVCRGGIIQVTIKGSVISVIGKEWDMSAGVRKSSNQSNAKEWTRLEVDVNKVDFKRLLDAKLIDLTTSYYTDVIMDWIMSKVDIDNKPDYFPMW